MLTSVQMSDTRWRRGISRAKGPMLAPVQHILARRADFSPLSDRSLRYALHNDPPLRHAAKPDSVCANDPASYHALTDLLTRAWPKEKLGGAVCARAADPFLRRWLLLVLVLLPPTLPLVDVLLKILPRDILQCLRRRHTD